MKTLNLEEILRKHIDSLKDGSPTRNLLSSNEVFQNDLFDFFMNLMKDVCQETLKLAADNAKLVRVSGDDTYILKEDTICDDYLAHKVYVSKESILNTINQIE